MPIDPAFLRRFIAERLPKLRAFARLRMPRELRQRESESDVMQEAVLQVLARGPALEFRGETALANWLFGAVENALRDLLKRHRRECRNPAREVRQDQDSALLQSYASLCTPSRILAAREEVQKIEAAMDSLSEHQREVVMLSCLVGLSHEAITAQTGMSAESVRTHLYRGLAKLSMLVTSSGGERS